MRKKIYVILLCLLIIISACGCQGKPEKLVEPTPPVSTHVVIDSWGREVEVPDDVQRIGCLYAISGHIVTMLGQGDKLVVVNAGLKRDIVLNDMLPSIQEAVVPKANGLINIEELVKANVDLLFVQNETARNEGEVEKLNKFNIPFLVVDYKNMEEQQYAVKMIGQAIGAEEEAQEYISYYQSCIDKVKAKTKDIPQDKKVRVYHSVNEASRTDARDTLPADWLDVTGAINVSLDEELRLIDDKYFASMEQILLWNPDLILVNEDGVDQYIMTNEQWATLAAVKNKKVYKMPNGISRWGHPGSLETPLAIMWTAKVLYPKTFEELDLNTETKDFYQRFFNVSITDERIEDILRGKGMRIPKHQ